MFNKCSNGNTEAGVLGFTSLGATVGEDSKA